MDCTNRDISDGLIHRRHDKDGGAFIEITNLRGKKQNSLGPGWWYNPGNMRRYAKWLVEIADELDPPEVEEYIPGRCIEWMPFGKSLCDDSVVFFCRQDDVTKFDEFQTEAAIKHMQSLLSEYRNGKADKVQEKKTKEAKKLVQQAVEILGVEAVKELL